MVSSVKVQEAKAVNTGFKDGLLTLLFGVAGYVAAYVVTLLPFLDTFQNGRYSWVKLPAAAILAAVIKGIDRKKHEDPSPSTGLVKI